MWVFVLLPWTKCFHHPCFLSKDWIQFDLRGSAHNSLSRLIVLFKLPLTRTTPYRDFRSVSAVSQFSNNPSDIFSAVRKCCRPELLGADRDNDGKLQVLDVGQLENTLILLSTPSNLLAWATLSAKHEKTGATDLFRSRYFEWSW